MANKKTTKKKASARSIVAAAETLSSASTGIVLTGRVKNGKLELDESCLRQIKKKFARADKAFVAVNAPFVPVTGIRTANPYS